MTATASAQDHAAHGASGPAIGVGAHAIGVVTRQSPGIAGNTLLEGYLTQPTLMAHAGTARNVLSAQMMLSLEGLTLDRGELNPGIVGEGYIDRRHPHTYLHELTATLQQHMGPAHASVTVGKGFAPFGTDDPMVRPFVKYPINHHLAQVLERIIAVAAVRGGPLVAEAGIFNGDEPESPGDAPNSDRLWDSWAARVTVLPRTGVEFQASYAVVRSPEFAPGGAPDDRKWSTSLRLEGTNASRYLLAEWARSDQYVGSTRSFSFRSALVEARHAAGRVVVAGRLEITERPDEERLLDPFRTVLGGHDFSILGRSRWTIATANLSAPWKVGGGQAVVSPFVEIAYNQARETFRPSGFVPAQFYGSDRIWLLSAGARLALGARHSRMGRYGAALPQMAGNRSSDAGTTHLDH